LQIRLTSVQRRLLSRTFLIGAMLTSAVVFMEAFGMLVTAERYFYDRRARACQFAAPPPSKQIVHVNIDDESLQEVGRWPWDRAVTARVIEEIRLAGAKVIALDIMMPEPQGPGTNGAGRGSRSRSRTTSFSATRSARRGTCWRRRARA
jgi:CHASE2 domain-containing sensor protein